MASSLMSFPSCVKSLSEPLFRPRIAAHVIAPVLPFLPEAGPVLVHQLDPADPLGAFPGVTPRHDQAQRIAVVWLQGLAVVLPGKEAILASSPRKSSSGKLVVNPCSQWTMTYAASSNTFTVLSTARVETPSQTLPSL